MIVYLISLSSSNSTIWIYSSFKIVLYLSLLFISMATQTLLRVDSFSFPSFVFFLVLLETSFPSKTLKPLILLIDPDSCNEMTSGFKFFLIQSALFNFLTTAPQLFQDTILRICLLSPDFLKVSFLTICFLVFSRFSSYLIRLISFLVIFSINSTAYLRNKNLPFFYFFSAGGP